MTESTIANIVDPATLSEKYAMPQDSHCMEAHRKQTTMTSLRAIGTALFVAASCGGASAESAESRRAMEQLCADPHRNINMQYLCDRLGYTPFRELVDRPRRREENMSTKELLEQEAAREHELQQLNKKRKGR